MTINELRARQAGVKGRLDRALDGAVKALHMRPDAVRNLLARRPKGWWVDYVRGVRGMEPLDRKQARSVPRDALRFNNSHSALAMSRYRLLN